MVEELHHRWNAAREGDRGSNKPVEKDRQEFAAPNKVLLKQNKPR